MKKLYHEIKDFKFLNVGKTDLDDFIGRRVIKIKTEGDGHTVIFNGQHVQGKVYWDSEKQEVVKLDLPIIFEIGNIQKLYNGEFALRGYSEGDSFGTPIKIDKCIFV